jgi:tRNA/tmRNA/rRNA uracil-C5-methylase (TrmA/RlmC/RlmD family)
VSGGFWQSHYAAAETLASAVLDAAAAQPGSHVVDLYAGVGLFGGSLASAGPARIDVVEGHRSAADDAASNLADIPEARVHATAVEKYLRDHAAITPDVVVLDPPRRGARRQVVEPIAAWRPRAVVYVACDPAALARDIATFADGGYRLAALRVFDLFPMTHHIECVALLSPAEA